MPGQREDFVKTLDQLTAVVCRQVLPAGHARGDADDLAGEVRLLALRAFDAQKLEYRGREPLAAWLRTSALRVVAQWSRVRIPEAGRTTDVAGALEASPDGTTPSRGARRSDDRVLLRRALLRLAPDLRHVVLRRDLERIPVAQIAREIGKSRDVTTEMVRRGRAELRRILESDGGTESALISD